MCVFSFPPGACVRALHGHWLHSPERFPFTMKRQLPVKKLFGQLLFITNHSCCWLKLTGISTRGSRPFLPANHIRAKGPAKPQGLKDQTFAPLMDNICAGYRGRGESRHRGGLVTQKQSVFTDGSSKSSVRRATFSCCWYLLLNVLLYKRCCCCILNELNGTFYVCDHNPTKNSYVSKETRVFFIVLFFFFINVLCDSFWVAILVFMQKGISVWHPYWQWGFRLLMDSAKPKSTGENVREKIINVLLFSLQPKKHSCGI